jgi:hypothetical protein
MKKTHSGFLIAVFAAAILSLPLAPLVSAQDYDRDDPPTRAGRLGYIEGSVSFQPGGDGEWVQAVPNRPLTVGDNLWVDRDSRAEVQIGSTSIRLGPETSLSFLDLGNDVTQLRLSAGSVFVRVRHFDHDDAFEVDTPNLAFNVDRPGEFRLSVNQNGDQTVATVWHGEGVITGGGNSYRLTEGQRGSFSGVDQLSYDVDQIGPQDPFDRWAMSRSEREDRARRNHYVSEEVTGYEDLDDYGRWHSVGGYGNVWTPTRVSVDWAPYRDGHWAYVSPWGWTWVDDEPWGFAPFHYGRWAFVESSWCWVPGPLEVRPVYSPALVAFVGGGGFSVGVSVGGGGGVGWFPLAPGEVFVPWYRTSPRYVERVNVSNTRVNVTQVTNVYNNVTVNHVNNVTYVNQRVTNSVTVVNHDTFVNARPVQRNIVRVDARQMASAPVTHDVARSIQPDRQSVVGATHQVQAKPPEQVTARQVVATRQPVVMNRREPAPGVARPAAPPPVKKVEAAPPAQAQQLQRGQRGNSAGTPPAGAGNAARPGQPENNRPGADNNRNPQQPGAPGNNRPGTAQQPSETPRPGAAQNERRPGQPENNRPGADNNRNVPQPGAPGNNRPGAAPQPNETPRPGAAQNERRPGQPENNRPGADNKRNVPQPDNSRPTAPRPGAPENRPPERQPASPQNTRPADVPRPPSASRPEQAPEQPRQNPNRPENARPGNPRPDNSRPENARPENARPESARPENARPAQPPQARPEPPARPREVQPPPRQNENRPAAAPPSRPDARPSEPPPPRNEKKNPPPEDKKNKDKEPPNYR